MTKVVDTGGKFTAGVVDTGGKFAAGVVDTICRRCHCYLWQTTWSHKIYHRCQRHRGKFATGINDTGGKFATGINDTGGK